MTIEELHGIFLKFPRACTDTRKLDKRCIYFALKGPNFDGNKYANDALKKGAKYAVIDDKKYTGENCILVDDVLQTLQRLATFHRNYCTATVIALTGSNGKTTTKELIKSVLSKSYQTIATIGNLNNHIGVPLTLLSMQPDTQFAIVEMGANHQKEIEFLCELAQPDFGYITNFGKAHLEGFGSEAGVIKGKSELYDYLIQHKNSIFLNADDAIQLEKLSSYVPKYGFSQNSPEYYAIEFLGAEPFVKLKVEHLTIQTKLIGHYNFTNCAVAILMGKYFNIPLPTIRQAIESYVPNNNRSQIITKNGHQIILDAYNANPTSMQAALENFKTIEGSPKFVFLGDMFELGETANKEHQFIADLAEQLDFKTTYLVGDHFANIDTSLKVFRSFHDLSIFLKSNPIQKKSHLLIKGSRGMALERLIEIL